MFSTRLRALLVTSITAVVVLLTLVDVNFLDYQNALVRIGVSNSLLIEMFPAALVSFLLWLGTFWVLYFKRQGNSMLAIVLFPAISVFPYLLLAESTVNSIFSDLGQFSVAFIASVIYWIATYFLILTANVLNGSVLFDIPLGQAGKASQFIFSLISSYFLIAFLFSTAFPIEIRLLVTSLFVFYFSYSTVWVQQLPHHQVLLSALAVTITMALVILLFSIWPITSVYATLGSVVVFYILLNVALEMREFIGKMVWIEYGLLVSLVVIILFTNAQWGINGTLL